MKKVFPALLLTLSLFLTKQAALACSCIYLSDYFCITLGESNLFGANHHITLGKVITKYNAGQNQGPVMDVEVIEWLKTEDPTLDTISVPGQDGLNCNESLSYFEVGDTVLLALYDAGGPGQGITYPIFNLLGCGRYFLHYSGGSIVGPIRPGVSSQPYPDFKSDLGTCSMLTDIEEIPEEDVWIGLYPNPASDLLNLKTDSRIGAPDRMYFLNAYGQTLPLKTNRSDDGMIIGVDVSALSPGLYFVVLEFGNSRRTKKWVKV